MLCAVAAASPATKSRPGSKPMAKKPPNMLIKYRPPAVLASCLGEAPAIRSITELPQWPKSAGRDCGDRECQQSTARVRWKPQPQGSAENQGWSPALGDSAGSGQGTRPPGTPARQRCPKP